MRQLLDQRLGRAAAGMLDQPQGSHHSRCDRLALGQRAELDQPNPVGLGSHGIGGKLDREPGLARSTGADQGQQPAAAAQAGQLGERQVTADERCQLGRQVGQAAIERPDRTRVRGRLFVHQLVDALGPDQVVQPVLAVVDQADTGREAVDRHLAGRQGKQHLSAVARRQEARTAIDGLAVIMAAAQLRLAGVEGDPNPQPGSLRPAGSREPALDGGGGEHRVSGPGEHRQNRVALPAHLDEVAAMLGQSAGHELIVEGHGGTHRRRVGFPPASRALDVGEQEGDRTFRGLESRLRPQDRSPET